MVFGNKMKSLLSRKPDFDFFFFFWLKLAVCPLPYGNPWLKVVTSHWISMEMRMCSQTMDSITAVLDSEKEVGKFSLQGTCISQNSISWIGEQWLGGQSYPFQLQPRPALPWLPPGHFYHLFCLSQHICRFSPMGLSCVSFLSCYGDPRTPADDSNCENQDQRRGD